MPDSPSAAPQRRLSFSEKIPLLQLAWDSTSLGELKTCPRKYYYSILCGYITHGDNVHQVFGLIYHSALEAYDRERAAGASHDAALLKAFRLALTLTWNSELQRPWTSDDNYKNRDTLLRSIVWYCDQFADDPFTVIVSEDGAAQVELSFRFELDLKSRLTEETFLLCGHKDKRGTFNGRRWVGDHKTTKSFLNQDYFEKYSPDNQISLYALSEQILEKEPSSGVIIDAAQIAVNFSRFQRQIITRTESQLAEWLTDAQYYIRQAENFVESNYWPMNDKSCNAWGGCPYRKVCSAAPEIRQTLLDTMYSRRSWDPLQTREV